MKTCAFLSFLILLATFIIAGDTVMNAKAAGINTVEPVLVFEDRGVKLYEFTGNGTTCFLATAYGDSVPNVDLECK